VAPKSNLVTNPLPTRLYNTNISNGLTTPLLQPTRPQKSGVPQNRGEFVV
jgi:hypothetical protein